MSVEAKMFEVLDRDTNYEVIALFYEGETDKEQWLLNRAGLGAGCGYQIQLTDLATGETHRSRFDWVNHGRTMREVHTYLEQYFWCTDSGSVIDVEFLNGEKPYIRKSRYVEGSQEG